MPAGIPNLVPERTPEPRPASVAEPPPSALLLAAQAAWRTFCRALVAVFYRRVELDGIERVPAAGPLLLCANHADALADAVIVQATMPRPVHPLARSGLFEHAALRPLLAAQQAVPIYRRQDSGSDTARNEESFARCHELLARGEALLIFPEGQSHSDPRLRPIKTGAARLALGALERNGTPPALLPIGLTFGRKGRFRSSVLVRIGEPVAVAVRAGESAEDAVRRTTAALQRGLESVTVNVDSPAELELLQRVRRFFAFRHRGGDRERRLANRLRALHHVQEVHRWTRELAPAETEALARRLRRFERLCDRYGVEDYGLTVRYTPWVVARFLGRTLFFGLVVLPLAAWAIVNSVVPYFATRFAARRLARGRDQHDTAKMLLGMGFFALFWGAQSALVFLRWGLWPALAYAASLPATAAMALAISRERERVVENVRMFLVFGRGGELRRYLVGRRRELEIEIARLVRRAKRARRATPTAPPGLPNP